MDAQGWWDELEAQLLDSNPVRQTVIECLKELLDAMREGEPFPTPQQED